MQLKTHCPKCQKALRCPEERINSVVRCPACRHKFRVSSASAGSRSGEVQASQEVVDSIVSEDFSGTGQRVESREGSAASSHPRPEAGDAQSGPSRFAHFELQKLLGGGGFGLVYRAWDSKLGRQVALKVPRFEITDDRRLRRFRQEARTAAKLHHPNIVVVLEEGQQGDKPFIVSEFVDGETLSSRMEKDRPDFRTSVQWVRDLANALAYAHELGVIHRDIKPDNIMLGSHGRPQIMDFGLAKQLQDDSSLSIDGSVLGTPNYMAPEQARGEITKLDGRTDQYSLGVVFYELLTGQKPFSGSTHLVMAQVADPRRESPRPRSVESAIPKDLEAVCQKAMSKDPADRYADLTEMAADLDRWLEGKPTQARPVSAPEQAWRWCRRNPALATLSSITTVALMAALSFGWSLMHQDSPHTAEARVDESPTSVRGSGANSSVAENAQLNANSESPTSASEDTSTHLAVAERQSWEGWPSDAPDPAIAPFNAEQAKQHQQEWAEYLNFPVKRKIELPGEESISLVLIPPGEFLMGSTEAEQTRVLNQAELDPEEYQDWKDVGIHWVSQEGPQINMTIDRPFYLGSTEVTISQWNAVMESAQQSESQADFPIEGVSFIDVAAFIKTMNSSASNPQSFFTLPPECCWEYACRAGTETAWHFGDSPEEADQFAWTWINSGGDLQAVAQLSPNPWGLWDMHGNAREWCSNPAEKREHIWSRVDTNDIQGPGYDIIMRSGSAQHTTRRSRSSSRLTNAPSDRKRNGFRVAMTIPDTRLPLANKSRPGRRRTESSHQSWTPTPAQQAFLEEVAQLPVEDQASAVARKLQEVNPGFDGEFEQVIEDGKVTEFAISTVEIADIWPVRGLTSLAALQCEGTYETRGKLDDLSSLAGMSFTSLSCMLNPISDLSPLSGMDLKSLQCNNTAVSDLSPLAGMPLRELDCSHCKSVSDLTPLRGMQLTSLLCSGTDIPDLKPLRGMQLTSLKSNHTEIADLSPLADMQLEVFECGTSRVANLAPLRGMPIQQLFCYRTLVSDLNPLLELPLSRRVALDIPLFSVRDEHLIENLTASYVGATWDTTIPANQFREQFAQRRDAAIRFAENAADLPRETHAQAIFDKLQELNAERGIKFKMRRQEGVVTEMNIQLTSACKDITPLLALKKLRKLTISGGPRWLDLSPINRLPIEELSCSPNQALRNRLMLADIDSLRTINGRLADQYLDSLVEPPSPPPELLEDQESATHPPLDQWLQGREVLTVAQDGSAMFTSIQPALDAQKDGQVVRVLDKGPYQERLVWQDRRDCGLISSAGTVITIPETLEPTDPESRVEHDLRRLANFRLHGFTFLYSPGEKSGYRGLVQIREAESPCIESVVIVPTASSQGAFYPSIWWTIDKGGDIVVRNNVFCGHQFTVRVVETSDVVFLNNWFRSLSDNDRCNSGLGFKGIGNSDSRVRMEANVTDRECSYSSHFESDFNRMSVAVERNTVASRSGASMLARGLNGQNVAIRNNLNLVPRNECGLLGVSSNDVTAVTDSWTIAGNLSNGKDHDTQDSALSLGGAHPTRIRMLSTDPLDRNFMRVDPSTISHPADDPFPGALPPGPAPDEGDWFTQLQARWINALDYVAPEERKRWSKPVEWASSETNSSQASVADSRESRDGQGQGTVITDEYHKIDMQLVASGWYRQFRRYKPLMSRHAPGLPEGVTKVPGLSEPYHGEIVSGEQTWSYIIDEPGEFPPNVYVDANSDKDYTNDPGVKWTGRRIGLEFSYESEFDVQLPSGQSVRFSANSRFFPSGLSHRVDFGYRGVIVADGEKIVVAIEGEIKGSALMFPENSPKFYANFSKPFTLNGATYRLKLENGELFVRLEEAGKAVESN